MFLGEVRLGYRRSWIGGIIAATVGGSIAASVSGIIVVLGYHRRSGCRWHQWLTVDGWRQQSSASSLRNRHHRCKIDAVAANWHLLCYFKKAQNSLHLVRVIPWTSAFTAHPSNSVNLPDSSTMHVIFACSKIPRQHDNQLPRLTMQNKLSCEGCEACWAAAARPGYAYNPMVADDCTCVSCILTEQHSFLLFSLLFPFLFLFFSLFFFSFFSSSLLPTSKHSAG